MKHLLLFFAAFSCLGGAVWGQAQTCHTPTRVAPIPAFSDPDPLDGDYCVSVYVEVDYDIVSQFPAGEVEPFTDGLLAEVSTLYAAQGIRIDWIVKYWTTPSPYTATSSSGNLYAFRDYLNANGGHPGNVAMLLRHLPLSGGVAFVDVFCSEGFGYSYSGINLDYRPYPQYSWSVMVIAHELGHNLGSPHTHNCSWPGGAIDGCSPGGTEGNCPDPGDPAEGGTVMSYCHLSQVGINLTRGFHPLPLALIKNRIAAGPCQDCDVPDEPEPECELNQVIFEIQLDNYPSETSWAVLTDNLDVVASGGPWEKDQMNTYHADTLCLPDGCYTLVVTDPDGLVGYGCGEGLYILNGPGGQELASGQSWQGQDVTPFCFGVEPPEPGGCDTIGPNREDLQPYANQDRSGGVTAYGDRLVKLGGNTWKAQPGPYLITPTTVLTFQAKIDKLGEIHAVAFVPNMDALYPGNTFRFGGSQAWGVSVAQIEPGGPWVDVSVPVGQIIDPGEYVLVLVNDDDVRGEAVSGWRNIVLCEDGAAGAPRRGWVAEGKLSDEVVVEDIVLTPYPNPTADTVTLPREDMWVMFYLNGRQVASGWGNVADLRLLPPGIYLVWQSGRTYKIVKE